MIASFKHRGLKALYEGRTARRVAPEHTPKLVDVLAVLVCRPANTVTLLFTRR